MLRQLLLVLQWLCLATFLSAQSAPSLTVKGDTTLQLSISDLHLEVKIVGNIATTTVDMRFYNPFDRILEGELTFPLADGQTISRYAMDVNGKLREGVIVEKQQGRQAFERIIRQKIDPGLLEMTEGNNFRTRVYPIPAHGYKQIVLAYEQELAAANIYSFIYSLPLRFKEKVQNFSIRVDVINVKSAYSPSSVQPDDLPFFGLGNGHFWASFKAKDYLPNRDYTISISKAIDEPQVFYQQKNKETYFYAILPIAPPAARFDEKLPKNIAIYWDVSASAANRDLEKESQLLAAYLKTIQDCKIQIITFSNAIHLVKKLEIKKGNTDEILQFLTAQAFDGGTQLGVLDFTKYKADEILLFTDGLSNFGDVEIKTSKTPVYAISSSATANPAYLKNLAMQTGGQYLDLQQKSIDAVLQNLTLPSFQFIKADFSTQALEEIFPSVPTIAIGQFTFAGKLKQSKATITLHFGYGNRTTYTQKLELTKPAAVDSSNVSRIWANKKLSELDQQFDKNKAAITALGKEFSIVTRNTSLIVLDRVEDYVTYEIVPPAELQADYYKLLEERKVQRSEEDDSQVEINDEITDAFEELSDWWEEDFPRQVAPPKPQPAVQPPTPQPVPSSPVPQPTVPKPIIPDSTKNMNIPLSNRIITGTILDAEGKEPLIGATVLAVGASVGTTTDVEGKYSIQLPVGVTKLQVSYTGFTSQLLVLGTSNVADVQLETSMALSEVVVVGYASTMKKSLTASVAKIEVRGNNTVLQGRAAGVQIVENTEGNVTAFVSSVGTISFDSIGNYLLLIDNYVATAEDFEEVEDDIVKIDFIEGSKATAMYGAKAAKGAILMQTQEQDFEPADSQRDTVSIFRASAAYLDSLRQASPEKRFATYLRLKQIFLTSPTFYYDIANFFFTNKQRMEGLRVLSNIAELDLENAELLRILGHALQQQGEYKMAVRAFQKVAEWRPEEPQSYRDLGLALEKAGQYQQALDMLYKVLKDFEQYDARFWGIHGTIIFEINNLIKKHRKRLNQSAIPKEIIKPMPMDIYVVLNWSSDMTDVDLYVTQPDGEVCSYKNEQTNIGGYIFEYDADGYGPEHYGLKKAKSGVYKIHAELWSDDRQRIVDGIIIQAYVYLYYGTSKQKEYSTSIRLDADTKKVDIMEFRFE